MYYVIQNKFILNYFFLGTKHEEDNDGSKKNFFSRHCCWNVLKCKIYMKVSSIKTFL